MKVEFSSEEIRKIRVSKLTPYSTLARLGEPIDKFSYTDSDGDIITISTNDELVDAINENNGSCIKIKTVSSCVERPTGNDEPSTKLPASDLIGNVNLEKVKEKLVPIEQLHVEEYGMPCSFKVKRQSGNIIVTCEICQTEIQTGDIKRDLQPVKCNLLG